MSAITENQTIKRLTMVIGIVVAIVACLSTTVIAREQLAPSPNEVSIGDEEVRELLQYLLQVYHQDEETVITIYNYDLELIYQGTEEELTDRGLLLRSDLMVKDGQNSILVVDKLAF